MTETPAQNQIESGQRVAGQNGHALGFDATYTQKKYDDNLADVQRLNELESRLFEMCESHAIDKPVFRFVTSKQNEVCGVAQWGSIKVQSYPSVFASEAGAKANVIMKALQGFEGIARRVLQARIPCIRLLRHHLESNEVFNRKVKATGLSDSTSGEQEISSSTLTKSAQVGNSTQNQAMNARPAVYTDRSVLPSQPTRAVPKVLLQGEPRLQNSRSAEMTTNKNQISALSLGVSSVSIAGSDSTRIRAKPNIDEKLIPCINMDVRAKPASSGYVTHVRSDSSAMVQVKGPGLMKWTQMNFDVDLQNPVRELVSGRWYMTQIEYGNEACEERALYRHNPNGANFDDAGRVKLYFADNGYWSFVDRKAIFEFKNYDEIFALPMQSIPVHVLGMTGIASPQYFEQICPSANEVLFYPGNSTDCTLSKCTNPYVPHVYIYNKGTKEVLSAVQP